LTQLFKSIVQVFCFNEATIVRIKNVEDRSQSLVSQKEFNVNCCS
jgi:hypothetical protein